MHKGSKTCVKEWESLEANSWIKSELNVNVVNVIINCFNCFIIFIRTDDSTYLAPMFSLVQLYFKFGMGKSSLIC